jgi:hypothetical protein
MDADKLAEFDTLFEFTYSHVFVPYGKLCGKPALCEECKANTANTVVFREMKPLRLCWGCYEVKRRTWSIIIVDRNKATGKFRWIGADAKDMGPDLSIAVKDWYNEWALPILEHQAHAHASTSATAPNSNDVANAMSD